MDTPVDNTLYRRLGHAWRDDGQGMFATIRFCVNPVRFGAACNLQVSSIGGGRESRVSCRRHRLMDLAFAGARARSLDRGIFGRR